MKTAAVMTFLLLLAACSAVPQLVGIEGVSTIITDKTLTDQIVSYASGKDCSTVRKERGLTYCVEDELDPQPLVYCYRTLGRASCYDRPDPYNGRQRRLGDNNQNQLNRPRRR